MTYKNIPIEYLLKKLGFREGRLSQEDYLEEQFIQGAFEGFSDGNLSGIVEGKI